MYYIVITEKPKGNISHYFAGWRPMKYTPTIRPSWTIHKSERTKYEDEEVAKYTANQLQEIINSQQTKEYYKIKVIKERNRKK